jgi:hypothetical protein
MAKLYGPVDSLYLAIRRRFPTVMVSCVKPPKGTIAADQPQDWLVVTYRHVGPRRIAWDVETSTFVWISDPTQGTVNRLPGIAIGSPDNIDQAADNVALELRAPAAVEHE